MNPQLLHGLIIGLITGLFIGANIGLLALALCKCAAKGEEDGNVQK